MSVDLQTCRNQSLQQGRPDESRALAHLSTRLYVYKSRKDGTVKSTIYCVFMALLSF